MTEMAHKHEWHFDSTFGAYCAEEADGICDERLEIAEVERRINAIECLSAETAKQMITGYEVFMSDRGPLSRDEEMLAEMYAYAAMREGKDG
jgi:hypothetical protein